MAKTTDVQALLARAYGPGQPGLSDDEEALLAILLRSPRRTGAEEVRLRRSIVPKVLVAVGIMAVVGAGLGGYGIGLSRSAEPPLDRQLPSVVVQLADGSTRDTRDAECEVELNQENAVLTGVTCTWPDGGTITLTTDGAR